MESVTTCEQEKCNVQIIALISRDSCSWESEEGDFRGQSNAPELESLWRRLRMLLMIPTDSRMEATLEVMSTSRCGWPLIISNELSEQIEMSPLTTKDRGD